jgi:hypothetical protein
MQHDIVILYVCSPNKSDRPLYPPRESWTVVTGKVKLPKLFIARILCGNLQDLDISHDCTMDR